MQTENIIKELDLIIVMADELKNKATSLRKQLERLYAPAPARAKKGLSTEQKSKILIRRIKHLNKPV